VIIATTSSTLAKRGSHLVFFLVLAGHGLLLSSQVTTERGHSALQGLILGLFSPLQRGGEFVFNGFRSTWTRYIDLRSVREENQKLREEVARLEQALWMEREVVASYDRLSQVLELAERLPFRSMVAEVVGLDATAWFQTITVNRGLEHGVALNAPVIAQGGVVGRVIAVGTNVAQVQLLSDRDCSVGALLARGRSRGIVSGMGRAQLQMKYVSNLEDVTVGDLVVTSGIDGMYPKGIALGRVATVKDGPRLFKIITIEPAARLDRLEEVFILEALDNEIEFIERVE
jgi:rod shape-determining protein MreC